MNVLGVLGRIRGIYSLKIILALFGFTVLVSCSVRRSQTENETSALSGEIQSGQQSADASISRDILNSRVFSSLETEAIGLELIEKSQSDELIINANAAPGDFTVDRISNPERIVIDIKTASPAKLNRNYDINEAQYLSKVRVGSHPDKTRIVLDLPQDRDITHQVGTQDNRLVVNLSSSAPQAAPEIAVVEAAEEAKASPDLEDNSLIEAEPKEQLPVSDTAARTETEYSSTVKSLSIEQIGAEGNVLIASVDSPGSFDLQQTSPSEYTLTLKDTKVDANASGQLAPPNKGLIRSVRAVQEGSDAVLRIFAQPNTKLNARAGSDKIVVSAIDMKDQAEIKAQAETEKPKAEPKDETVSKPVEVKEEADGDAFEKQLDELATSNYTGRLISLDLQDTDIDNALRIIAEVSNLNIIASDDVTGKVTLRLIDVPWDQALDVILKTNGLDKVQEGNVIRIAPVEKLRQEREALKQLRVSQDELEPLQVKYIRISYAKASELKPLIETVISERGVVSYDERSNQIIIKDISSGIKNASELISRVDLRTPQVLLETQIVEASRTLLRDLGAEMGFQYIASPATGNATGYNFPNTVDAGADTNFPAAVTELEGSAINILLGSADGTKNLNLTLTTLEKENRVRVISRPAVATTNNKQATIKSVEKIRVKTPDGGLSVATGSGATASGSSATATESFEVGIVLEVTPQASPDYYVLLDINAKSSTFGSNPVEGIPSELERSATSTVLVSSGQTFAMGGIYKTVDRDEVSGVPFIKDIPFIGTFFRRMLTNNTDEELLFFITPRIVEGSFDDATMKFSS